METTATRNGTAQEGDGELLVEIPKGNARGEVIRVFRRFFRGKWWVDVRTWFPGATEFLPGKGICIPAKLLPEVLAALQAAAEKQGSSDE